MPETSAHREEAAKRLSEMGRRHFSLIEFDDNEQLVTEIRKHPFGLFLIVVGGIIISFIITVIPMIIAVALREADGVVESGQLTIAQQILVVIGLILGVGGLIVTGINAILYRNNVIYVTTEKIAQVLYISLFNRKISQLSIGDVQDSTVSQNGFFPHIFNYGTLVVETAGEQQNYTFTYVPKPFETSRLIVGAHEENLKLYGN